MANFIRLSFIMRYTDTEDILEAIKYIMNNWSQSVTIGEKED